MNASFCYDIIRREECTLIEKLNKYISHDTLKVKQKNDEILLKNLPLGYIMLNAQRIISYNETFKDTLGVKLKP